MAKQYVHVKFKGKGSKRATWYWALKLGKGRYMVVSRDGNECISEKVKKDGVIVCTKRILIGKPEDIVDEVPARMNWRYEELEEVR